MKKLITITLVLCIFLFITPVAVLASDVSEAQYLTRFIVTNNSSSAITNAVVTFDLSTADMITSGMLGANATDYAMRTSGGTDVAAQASVNSTSPWCTFVSSISGNSQVDQYLYSKDVTGGKLAYFPDSDGMTVPDDDTLEISGNGTASITAFIDTDNGSEKNIFHKQSAISIYSGNQSETVICNVAGNYTSPTGFTPDNWVNEANGYDDDTGTYASKSPNGETWTEWLIYTFPETRSETIRWWYDREDASVNNAEVRVYDTGWVAVWSGNPSDTGQWNEISFSTRYITQISIRLYNSAPGIKWARVHEVDYDSGFLVSATGVETDEHDIKAQKNDSFLGLGIDSGGDTTFPSVTDNLSINFPLWSEYLDGGTIVSVDSTNAIATVTNAIWSSQGRILDGTGDYITFPVVNLAHGTPWTVEYWFYAQVDISTNTIVGNSNGGEESRLEYRLADRLSYYTTTAYAGAVTFGSNILDRWIHVVVSSNGTTVSFYENSAYRGGYTPASCSLNIQYLGRGRVGLDYGQGIFGEARIYNGKGLTQSEITANYNATKGKYVGDPANEFFEYIYSAVSVPNTSANWTFGGDVTLYIISANITKNGVCTGSWAGEYDTTFTDLSGNGNDATPSIRTTGSSEYLTATISSQVTTLAVNTPASDVTGGWTMITTIPTEPPGLFDEGGTDFPGGPEIDEFATAVDIPYMWWMVLIAMGSSILLGAYAYSKTHNTRTGRNGSLAIFWLTSTIVYVIWYIGGGGVVPGWPLIVYGLWCICLMLWFNPFRTAAG